jgi:hypothetical protein
MSAGKGSHHGYRNRLQTILSSRRQAGRRLRRGAKAAPQLSAESSRKEQPRLLPVPVDASSFTIKGVQPAARCLLPASLELFLRSNVTLPGSLAARFCSAAGKRRPHHGRFRLWTHPLPCCLANIPQSAGSLRHLVCLPSSLDTETSARTDISTRLVLS